MHMMSVCYSCNQSTGSHDDIVNLKDHPDHFSRQGQCTLSHQGRLKHIFLLHVDDISLTDTDTRPGLALSMSVTQFSHHIDGTDACVFSQSVRNDFQGLSVATEDDSL